jgi:hypothetical protein
MKSGRKVEFVSDGQRRFATPQEIVAAWERHTDIDARYALGTAQHESGFALNERDTEPSGFVSMGIYQISQDEMNHVGMRQADPYDLEECTIVFAQLTEERLKAIVRSIGHFPSESPDANAYLFIAHNQGLAACLKSIKLHGMDWTAYKKRNGDAARTVLHDAVNASPVDATAVQLATEKLRWWDKVFAYGDDVISGGSEWPNAKPVPTGPQVV